MHRDFRLIAISRAGSIVSGSSVLVVVLHACAPSARDIQNSSRNNN